MRTAETLLAVEDLTVEFDGFKAIDSLNFYVDKGGVRVLIGPNGAGKSTLCDTIIGRVRPRSGRILFRGEDITRLAEFRIVRKGICRKFQTPGVLQSLSVHDNLALAARKTRDWWHAFGNRLSATEQEQIDQVLALIGLGEKRDFLPSQLSHGEKQWLEIGMVVATEAELLLLDEPTAGMSPQETSDTADLIRRLVGRHTVLVIDHDMSFVEQLDAPVSVLHMGALLKEGTIAEVRSDPEVAAVYLGRIEDAGAA